jgi:hypothetical protein
LEFAPKYTYYDWSKGWSYKKTVNFFGFAFCTYFTLQMLLCRNECFCFVGWVTFLLNLIEFENNCCFVLCWENNIIQLSVLNRQTK